MARCAPKKRHQLFGAALIPLFVQACLVPAPRPLPSISDEGVGNEREAQLMTEVEIRSTGRPVVTELRAVGSREPGFACLTPCRTTLPSGRYRVTASEPGGGAFDGRAMDLYGDGVQLVIEPGDARARMAGRVLVPSGAVVAGFGLGGVVLGATLAAPPCDPLAFMGCASAQPNDAMPFIAGGLALLVTGIALVAVGTGQRGPRSGRIDIHHIARQRSDQPTH